MNASIEGSNITTVALKGRSKVVGPVRKGDVLIASEKTCGLCPSGPV